MDEHLTIGVIGGGKIAGMGKGSSARSQLGRDIVAVYKVNDDVFVKQDVDTLKQVVRVVVPDLNLAGEKMGDNGNR